MENLRLNTENFTQNTVIEVDDERDINYRNQYYQTEGDDQ